MKSITIFGSTGSIGTQTLDVVSHHSDHVKITGLAAGSNMSLLSDQIKQWHPQYVVVAQEKDALTLQKRFPNILISWGDRGLVALAGVQVDTIVMALIGFVGLAPIIEALRVGQRVALANKEPIVAAGELFDFLIREHGGTVFPVDSEHSAIYQSLHGKKAEIEKIFLTASGGPFYHSPGRDLSNVSVEEAIRHPKWKMGRKLSVDSATLMNKGLEVIEARWLFGLQPNQLDVVIHPQSLVHALVQYCDGSLLAHMGYPDMRMPIAYALSYPERWALSLPRLSWSDLSGLRFDTPDFTRFPALTMAFEVNRMAGCMPASMSAANEVAVTAFLDGLIRFTDIIPLVQHVLEETTPRNLNSVECVIEADRLAREKANLAISRMREKR